MAGPPSYPDTSRNSQDSVPPPGRGPYAGRSRWKTAAIAVIVVAVLALMLILHLTGALGLGTHG
jgi:hypothetical protein